MTQEITEESPITPREFRTALAGLLLSLALGSLDQTIVGVALPRIVSELGGLSHLPWVVTSFLVTSTATTPLYGKLSDMYGRKPLYLIAIVIFILGSCLCGLSRSMLELVIFRGIQGLGAGGLMVLAITTIADLVSPRERGRYQGLFSAVFAFSSITGPLLGGFITDTLSWRWIFYVNVPTGILALGLIGFGFRRSPRKVSHRIDYAGALLLTAATVILLLVLSWGGALYPWSSPLIMGMTGVAALLCYALLQVERRAREPLLPPPVFRNKAFVVASGVMALTLMALFGAAVFLPLFFQLVMGMTPAQAGLMLAPMTGGTIVTSFIGGQLVTRSGRYKIFPVIGLAVAAFAFTGVMWAAKTAAGILVLEVFLVMLGLGFGLVMPNLVVAIQNAVDRREIGTATATSTFFRQLGGMFGVAMSGAVMTMQLQTLQVEKLAGMGKGGRALIEQGVQEIARLPVAQKALILEAYRQAITTTFLLGSVITACAFVLVLFLPEHPLRLTQPPDSTS